MLAELDKLKIRCRKGLVRKIDNGEVEFDPKLKKFVYTEGDEELKLQWRDGEDDSDYGDESGSDDEEER